MSRHAPPLSILFSGRIGRAGEIEFCGELKWYFVNASAILAGTYIIPRARKENKISICPVLNNVRALQNLLEYVTITNYTNLRWILLKYSNTIICSLCKEITPALDTQYYIFCCSGVLSFILKQRCARGYHRVNVSGDFYLGKCERCNCNGHSDDCDPATGQCLVSETFLL